MKLKIVYLLRENYETTEPGETKFGTIVPKGTTQKPVSLYVIRDFLPIFDEKTNNLYYPIIKILRGHGAGEWDLFPNFVREKDEEIYKFCYMISSEIDSNEEPILLEKSLVKFIFINLQDYKKMINEIYTIT